MMRDYSRTIQWGRFLGALLFLLLAAGCAADSGNAAPKGLGQMTLEEVRDEVHRLYRDDLPFAPHIRSLTLAADNVWPTLNRSQQIQYQVHVYAPLMDALRLLTNVVRQPVEPAGRRNCVAINISKAIDGLKQHARYAPFYKEVFESPEFKDSDSVFHPAVVELWTRYERAGKPVPYTHLLCLNQPIQYRREKVGGGGDYIRSSIAGMYAELDDHDAEAKWYEGVGPTGLGPLKAADALFAAKRFREAGEKYNAVLSDLQAWAALKPTLKKSALAEPLEDADLDAVRKHAETRLAEIKRLQ